jgi:hypothetical protein
MEKKTYEEKYVDRYTAYLNEVVSHFNDNKKLRNFSKIARKHKITSVTKEQFFELNLHIWGNKPLTREKVIEVLDVITNRKTNNSNLLPENEFITFIHENGCRSITFNGVGQYNFDYMLNYRGRKGEEDMLWIGGSFSELRNLEVVKSTKEDISRFCVALLSECSYLSEELALKEVHERTEK